MIGVIGGGAFGTALAIALSSDGTDVRLWMRAGAKEANLHRENRRRLEGCPFPASLRATQDLGDLNGASAILLALPAQQTEGFVANHTVPDGPIVLCAKGVTREHQRLQTDLLPDARPVAVLTGPGFAAEIANGLPTALTLASRNTDLAQLQKDLSRNTLRLYRTDDIVGAQLGGALKNVVAIAAGVAIGAGLGESARAAIVTRGFAEIRRLATKMGAKDSTLSGLSGFGDLMLTCGSEKSRNFAFGCSLAKGAKDTGVTVEGIATAEAAAALGQTHAVDMPVSQAVLDVLSGSSILDVMNGLLARPLRAE